MKTTIKQNSLTLSTVLLPGIFLMYLFFMPVVKAADVKECIDSQMEIALENWDTDSEENNMKELNKQIESCIKVHSTKTAGK